MIFNCLITGVGGQGTELMSRLIGTAALSKGLEVRGSETAGMAQRGGSVASHIRMGKDIHSPLIPPAKADLVIAFEPAEAVRVHTFIAPAGRMLVLDRAIMPVTGQLAARSYESEEMLAFLRTYMSRPTEDHLTRKEGGEWLTAINGEELIKKCGGAGVLNTALLGTAAEKKLFPFSAEDILAAITERIPSEYREANIRAFNAGRELAR